MLEVVMLFVRVAVGLFFAISGYHKLTDANRHSALVETLKQNKIPFAEFNSWWVPSVEFAAGIAVVAGFMFPLPLLGLLVICIVACSTDGVARIIAWKPIDKADLLDDVLYLPETLYIILILTLLAYGMETFTWEVFQ